MSNGQHQTDHEYLRRIHHAMNYITANIDQDLKLDDIAKQAMFSKFHFHRIFHAVTNETVAEFTRRVRLQTAANLLLFDQRKDITTIALACGFSSSQNFAKAFRKHFDQSPSQFRANPQDNPFYRPLENSKTGNTQSNSGNASQSLDAYHADSLIVQNYEQYRSQNMAIQIKEMPTYRVAYVRTYGLSDKTCGDAYNKLFQWAGPRGYADGTCIGLCWDNPDITPEDKCRFDACIDIPEHVQIEGDVSEQIVSGGKYAVGRYTIEDSSKFAHCWDDIFQWLLKSGYQPDDKPCYQIMHCTPDTNPDVGFDFEICVPVKPL